MPLEVVGDCELGQPPFAFLVAQRQPDNRLETTTDVTNAAPPVVSVCVLSWNSKDVLRECLRTLYSQPSPLPMEIVLVDNASGDGSPDMVAQEFPQVRLLAQSENLMFSRGMNTAARAALGDFLLFLNSDCYITPDTLAEMVGFLQAHPQVLLLSPCLRAADGTVERAVSEFPGIAKALRKLALIPRGWGPKRLTSGPPAFVAALGGACLLAPRRLLDEVGLYDEDFTMGMEDGDLCYRVHRAGYQVCYMPQCRVIHLNSHSRRKLGRVAKQRHVINGGILLAHKHHSLSYRRLWAALELPLFVRAVLPRLLLVLLTGGRSEKTREGLAVRLQEWRFICGLWARSPEGILSRR